MGKPVDVDLLALFRALAPIIARRQLDAMKERQQEKSESSVWKGQVAAE